MHASHSLSASVSFPLARACEHRSGVKGSQGLAVDKRATNLILQCPQLLPPAALATAAFIDATTPHTTAANTVTAAATLTPAIIPATDPALTAFTISARHSAKLPTSLSSLIPSQRESALFEPVPLPGPRETYYLRTRWVDVGPKSF